MTDSEKLRALATWFDITDAMKNKQLFDNEVQIDLRAMADRIEQSHKPVVMQGLPTKNEISAMACLTVVEECVCEQARIIHKNAFEEGARWVISELSSSPAVADGAAGKTVSVCDCDIDDTYKINGTYYCAKCNRPIRG